MNFFKTLQTTSSNAEMSEEITPAVFWVNIGMAVFTISSLALSLCCCASLLLIAKKCVNSAEDSPEKPATP